MEWRRQPAVINMSSSTTKFPSKPSDGMKFTDKWRRKWIYSDRNSSWQFSGFLPDVPIASNDTVGLLSQRLKVFIDSIKQKAGSFGVIASNNFGKTKSSVYSNVLSGNIKLKSETLDIECISQPQIDELGINSKIDIKFKKDFLDTICVVSPARPGGKGIKGPKGEDGEPGTGDGPKGLTGDPGEDAVVASSTVSEVEVIFDDAFYESAITEIFLDADRAILSATRSSALVPTEDTPASEVVAIQTIRDIEFISEDSFDFRVVKPDGISDPFDDMPTDTTLLAYPSDFNPDNNSKFIVGATGCCCEEADNASVVAVKFSEYVEKVIDKYQKILSRITDEYDRELRDFIFRKDEEARKALDVLVQKLSDEQFKDSFEYCMNMVNNGICGQQCCNEISRMRQDPYNNPGIAINKTQNEIGRQIIEKLNCLCTSPLNSVTLLSGNSEVSSELYENVTSSYGIPTLSQNHGLIDMMSQAAQSLSEIPKGWQFSQFTFGPCVFSEQILSNYGFDPSGYCPGSETQQLTIINIRPGDQIPIRADVGPTLKSGAYILQYKSGSIYDSGNPGQGYVVGTGTVELGLVLRIFKSGQFDTNGEPTEIVIPWPKSSISNDPFCKEEIESSYLLGPITEMTVGAIIETGDRAIIECISSSQNANGVIELSLNHCARCIE